MNFIVYDLEFNQKDSKDNNTYKLNFEIIQIGAFKLNDKLEIISTFNSLVKPTLYTTVHPYVEGLTKISTEDLYKEKTFPYVYNDFINFIGENDYTLCTWGMADIKELLRNIEFHNLSDNLIVKKYIDVQNIASTYFNTKKGIKIGLKNAAEGLNIPIKHDFHDAFNDAYYTSEIFKILYNPNINTLSYNLKSSYKRNVAYKSKIDTKSLINQFEKMYNRKMTDEEISIIKLSYIMGKTNQFLI
ncbi:exonuclease domain-containing protein [Clostridium paraputrificum]|uniref:exonuclease domain-containing protein n=1 Tax=Clostridium TaxID=1485 RepID=UPI003D346454